VCPPGPGERARDRDEELRQDAAGVGVRGGPPPRPRAVGRRPAVAGAERSVNVTCPSCETVYRVDPAKVPAGGVRARCAVCSTVFGVGPSAATTVAPTPVAAAQRTPAAAVATPQAPPARGVPPPAPPGPPAPPAPPAPPRPPPPLRLLPRPPLGRGSG